MAAWKSALAMNDEQETRQTALIVDDDPTTRLLVRSSLEGLGVIVEEAADGEEALAVFSRQLPDLVIMDIQMPKLSGIDACKKIRALPEGAAVPIVMLTGLTDPDSIKASEAAGATDYITKPINWHLLQQTIGQYLKLRS